MRTLTLNIIKGYGLDPVLNVSQFDKGYTVTATVQKGAESFTPPTGSTATVEGRKPDGTGYQYPATIDGSTVTFTMAEQMTVLSGRSMAEIVFYDADAVRIGTANFYIIVEAAPLNESTVISETDLPTIQQALDLLKNGALAPGIIGTASGDVAAFSDGARDTALSSLAVNIAPVQSGSGDPSPTNIRPISGWTEVNVTRAGKNLLPPHAVGTVTANGITWTMNADGTVVANGTATANATLYIPDNIFNVPVPAPLILTGCPSDGSATKYRIFAYKYLNGTNTGESVSDLGSSAILDPTDGTFNQVRIALRVTSGYTANNLVFRPMLRVASITDATYEPYAGETFPVTLPTEAGTVYGGVVDPVKGTLTVDRKAADMGSLTWAYNSHGYFDGYSIAMQGEILRPESGSMLVGVITSIYTEDTSNHIYDGVSNNVVAVRHTNGDIWVRDTRYTNAAAFKTAMSGIMLVYKLATPVEYDLTPTQIKTLYGFNTIYADCGSIESVEYTADTKMYIDSLITAIQSNIAYIEGGTTATRAYTAGQYVIVGGTLYKVTASIASGATFTPGTNIVSTTVGAELTAL